MKVLIFEVAGRSYALPGESVRRVDEPMPVTPLPFVPSYVEGLTASGGRVLPQIDLAARLGLAESDPESELLVVCGRGGDFVLRIGRARRMMDLADADLTNVGAEIDPDGPDAAAHPMIAAEFQWEDQPVFLLHADALAIEGTVAVAPTPAGEAAALLGDIEAGAVEDRRGVNAPSAAVMAVEAGGERYAFPLLSVSEVYADTALTPLPNAPHFVSGISVLRGEPRLVVSLARLLGLPAQADETSMVAAVAGDRPLVFQCARLFGIKRYPEDRREAAGDRTGCVDSYLIGEDGSVTGLLALDGLVPPELAARLDTLLPRARDTQGFKVRAADASRRMLLIGSGAHTCGIDIDRIDRIIGFTAPVETPEAAGMAIGMTDVDGRVLPVADLGREFGAPLRDAAAAAYVVVRTSRSDGFGLWALPVERLERLVDVPVSSVRVSSGGGGLVAGVGRVADRLITILDVDGLETTGRAEAADAA